MVQVEITLEYLLLSLQMLGKLSYDVLNSIRLQSLASLDPRENEEGHECEEWCLALRGNVNAIGWSILDEVGVYYMLKLLIMCKAKYE